MYLYMYLRIRATTFLSKHSSFFLLVAIMMKFIVGAQCWQGTHATTVGKKDLRSTVDPDLTI